MPHRKEMCVYVPHIIHLLSCYDAAKFINYILGRQQLFLQYIHLTLVSIDGKQQLFLLKLFEQKKTNTT